MRPYILDLTEILEIYILLYIRLTAVLAFTLIHANYKRDMLVELKLTSVIIVKQKYLKKKTTYFNMHKCNSLYIHLVCALMCGDCFIVMSFLLS